MADYRPLFLVCPVSCGKGITLEEFKVLFIFLVMMIALLKRAPLGFVMLGGAVFLVLFYQITLGEFLNILWRATSSLTTLELIAILLLIMIFERLLSQQGYLDRMLTGMRGLIRDRRVVMAFMPFFIGLMPSAGGALFSAPLVGQAADGSKVTAEEKSFVNVYYRHVWEYFLPLYPSIILAAQLSETPLHQFIGVLAPYGLLTILLGMPILFRIPGVKNENCSLVNRHEMVKEFLLGILPLLVVVGLVLVAKLEAGLALGMILLVLFAYHRYTPLKLWRLCREAIVFKTLFLVWGIMVFKQTLVDTRAVDGLPSLLAQLPVPEFLVFGLVSFLVGMFTGLAVAFIGITFPIIIATGNQINLHLAVFTYVAGFAGVMLTPMHLCLALTVEYFMADLQKVIRMIAGPQFVLLFVAALAYLLF